MYVVMTDGLQLIGLLIFAGFRGAKFFGVVLAETAFLRFWGTMAEIEPRETWGIAPGGFRRR